MTFDPLLINDISLLKGRYVTEEKVRVDIIAEDLIKVMHLKTIIDNEEILYYEDGIYKMGGTKRVKEILMSKLGSFLKKYHIAEVIAQIQGRTYVERDTINTSRIHIHMNNGIYNIETHEFIDFTPNIISTVKIPVDYDPDATCPKIDKFLTEVLTEGDLGIIYELFGYVLYRGYPFQTAFMFNGGGSNGKSVLINLINDFVGNDNISNKTLQDLVSNVFATSALYGMMVNTCADISNNELKTTGIFKALTGGDYIDAQRKFQNEFHFRNTAKLIFSCNSLPNSKDNTEAFFRRWIIVDFPNKFEGRNADKVLIDKLTTKSELSGLFNRAVSELIKILEQDGFSYSETTENTKERYIRLSDSLSAFVMDCVESSSDSYISKEEFYNTYSDYCDAEQLLPKNKQVVGSELSSLTRVTTGRRGGVKDRKPSWVGIKLIEDSEITQEDKIKLLRGIILSEEDGVSKKFIVEKCEGILDSEGVDSMLNHLKTGGSLQDFGGVIMWLGD